MEKKGYIFSQYIRQAADLLYGNIDPEKITPLQNDIAEAPNQCSPFRECTANHLRTKGPEGPLYDTTNAGLFSAVVWRAVLLYTCFENEHKMVFEDLEDWEEEIKGLDEEYVCNTRAHVTSANRRSSFGPVYWESIHNLGWEEYSATENHPTFSKTYDMLYNTSRKGRRPFPQLGPIGTLHLAGDIAYAGVYDQVTLADIGKFIFNIDSSSSCGAATLIAQDEENEDHVRITGNGKGKAKEKGKTKTKKLPAIQCGEGAREAFFLINHTLTKEEKVCIGPNDPILTENALCKFQGMEERVIRQCGHVT